MIDNYRVESWVCALLGLAAIILVHGVGLVIVKAEDAPKPQYFTPKDFGSAPRVEHPPTDPRRFPTETFLAMQDFRNEWEDITVTYSTVHTEYLGRYFLTAYSDEETYSRETASGIEVHYSEDPFEPTTCAIDRNYHSFGDLFMIDGKVYIAEDTGAFRGLWIDCFVETMEEVREFNTRYESVYSVSFEKHILTKSERLILHERFNNYLHDRSAGDRNDRGDDRRVGN